MSEDHILIY